MLLLLISFSLTTARNFLMPLWRRGLAISGGVVSDNSAYVPPPLKIADLGGSARLSLLNPVKKLAAVCKLHNQEQLCMLRANMLHNTVQVQDVVVTRGAKCGM